MSTQFRKCSKCPEYSFKVKRCLLGKINPPTIKGAVEAMTFFGPSYICNYSKVKTKAIKKFSQEVNRLSLGKGQKYSTERPYYKLEG